MRALLSELQALEVELHHPGSHSARIRLQELLHAEFHEVGRSGREYDRTTVLEFLSKQETPPSIVSDKFAVFKLGPNNVLLTYRSANRQANGSLADHTLRSSIWVETNNKWQLRYHQGTSAAEPWSVSS